MIKRKAIIGIVIAFSIISMVGCGNREEHSNKTLVINQDGTNVVEVENGIVDSPIFHKNNEVKKPIDYSFMAFNNKKISAVKDAGVNYLNDGLDWHSL